MEINYKLLEEKLIDEIDIILHAKAKGVIEKIKSNNSFQEVLQKEFNILFFLTKKTNSDEKLKKNLLKFYQELVNNGFEINKDYVIEDEYVIVDEINYLSIYVKNIFKCSIEDLSKLDSIKPEPKPTPIPNQFNGSMPNMNPEGIQQTIAYASASMKLQADINSGKVYPFATKPTLIYYLKKAFAIILVMFAIAQMAIGAVMFCIYEYKCGLNDKDEPIYKELVFNGIMYVLIGLGIIYYWYKEFYKIIFNKDVKDIDKYTIRIRGVPLFIIFFFIFFIVFDLFSNKTIGNICLFDSISELVLYNPDKKVLLYAWFGLFIAILVIFALIAVCIVLARRYNPKYDKDRIDELIKQYMDGSSSSIPPIQA